MLKFPGVVVFTLLAAGWVLAACSGGDSSLPGVDLEVVRIVDEEHCGPPSTGTPLRGPETLGASSARDLADRLAVDVETIRVDEIVSVTWCNMCLGVYFRNTACAQAITRGFRVGLTVDGTQYTYHTATTGPGVAVDFLKKADDVVYEKTQVRASE